MSAVTTTLDRGLPVRWMVALVTVLVAGNVIFSRGFAHLGVGMIFVGDVLLVALILLWPRQLLERMVGPLFKPSAATLVSLAAFVFIAFGCWQTLRSLLGPQDSKIAIVCFAFHVYATCLFLGMNAAATSPDYLGKLLTWLAWAHGIYGVLYVSVLSPLGWVDGEVHRLFAQPYGAALSILGLLCFHRKLGWHTLALLLNIFTLLGVQVRAEWLSLGAALLLWAVLSHRAKQLFQVAALAAVLIAAGLITDFKIPAPSSRGGDVSVRFIVGRALSSIDPSLAASFVDDPERYASTISWRTEWWREILAATHASTATTLIGLGYGHPIWDYHPEGVMEGLRTPHSIWVYVLGYTGWLGMAVYALFQLALLRLLWKSYVATRQPFGICLWTIQLIWATFDNLLEAPYGAIPFNLLLGMSLAAYVTRSFEPADASCGFGIDASLQPDLGLRPTPPAGNDVEQYQENAL